MDNRLQRLTDTMVAADSRVRGAGSSDTVWPTGFDVLDEQLHGGFRSGDLILLGGPQGMGKTTFVLQVARNVARQGRPVLYFCYEHDQTTMLVRLVALEAGIIGGSESANINQIREQFEASDGQPLGLPDRLSSLKGAREGLGIVREYSDRLTIHRSSGRSTSIDFIRETVEKVRAEHGTAPFVCLDYIQKIPVPGVDNEDERVTRVAEEVKDMTLDLEVPALSIVAMEKEGIQAGKRMRASHMRGSSALAYEADVILMLNNKYDVVARHHLVYDAGNVERFREWAILSIEKNRNGQSGIDLEFPKRFTHSRFETRGQVVREKLVDERVFTE